jgi:hypothetical protein
MSKQQETSLIGLKSEELRLLSEIMNPDSRIQVLESVGEDANRYWQQLSVCCQAMNRLNEARDKIRPIIGKLLLIAQKNPSLYRELGYGTFDQFLSEGVCGSLGLSRTDAYNAKRVASKFPSLTPEAVAEIGPVKLDILCRALPSEDDSRFEKAVALAKALPVEEFKNKFLRTKDEIDSVTRSTIAIRTTKEIAGQWKEFVNRDEVIAVCGTRDHGVILQCMMQECLSTWVAIYNQKAESASVVDAFAEEVGDDAAASDDDGLAPVDFREAAAAIAPFDGEEDQSQGSAFDEFVFADSPPAPFVQEEVPPPPPPRKRINLR